VLNSPTEDVSFQLARHIADLSYGDLPTSVVEATKRSIVDTIAATIAGSNQPGIVEALSTLKSWKGKHESTVAIWGDKLPAHEAVIANVAMAHALEIDDSHYPAIVHPTSPSLWSALADAEARGGASGKELILGAAAGIDLMARMGLASPRTLYLGYHTAMFSGFGAVAAVGKLRQLDAGTLQHALGIMVSQASATVQAATDGALVKRLQPAFNAADGIRAVDLAERGVTGLQRAFEGPYGLYKLFNHSACNRDVLLKALGKKFYGDELTVKRYPTSRCCHGPIEATLALVKDHQISHSGIEKVIVEVSEGCVNIAGAPYDISAGGSQTFAQFNIRYTVAAALYWRNMFVAEMQPDAIVNPEVVELSRRIDVVANPSLRGGVAFVPVTVRILMRDGTEHRHTVTSLKGSPENPMSWNEIVEERLMRAGQFGASPFDGKQLREIAATISDLDQLDDVRTILPLLDRRSSASAKSHPSSVMTGSTGATGADDAAALLAQHARQVRFEDIPLPAVEATKKAILDLIATTIAGADAPKSKDIVDWVTSEGGIDESRIALFGGKVPAPQAALANIMMCHALELDDLYDPAVVHANAPSFWSSMAIAEARGGASGRDLLTSMIVGSDIMCRIGAAAERTFSIGHHNALLAGFAAVGAGGSLGQLPKNIIHDAFGLSFAQAAASVQALPDGALVKRLQPAFNARDGLRSIAFAKAGVTGVQHVLEGKFGFCRLFGHASCDRNALLSGLGERFLGAESSIKRFPSSRCTHGPIEATLALHGQHSIALDQVVTITCAVSEVCVNVAGGPFDAQSGSPQVRAQFSIPYTVASALLNGDFFINQISKEMTNDQVLSLARKVKVVPLPEVGSKMTFKPVELTIELKSGERLFHRLDALKGTPEAPLDWNEIVQDRLIRCIEFSSRKISRDSVARLVDLVRDLENVKNAATLLDALS